MTVTAIKQWFIIIVTFNCCIMEVERERGGEEIEIPERERRGRNRDTREREEGKK